MARLLMLATVCPSLCAAEPTGAEVVHGQAHIDGSVPGLTTITNSPNAIIEWQQFSVAADHTTRFIQQSSQSAVLNRVIGGDPSAILGQLLSNGKVLLINPNGVVFGANATVDTQGLLVSSLNLANEDFLTGNYHFIAGGDAGGIVNEGIIRGGRDGNIILIAPNLENNGVIHTDGGHIVLAAGQSLLLTSLDDPDIRFQVQAPEHSALNLGQLLSAGGAISVFAGSIHHSGVIDATSVQVDARGEVRLAASDDITVAAGGRVSADHSAATAGEVRITSEQGQVTIAGAVSAHGGGQGGRVAVTGKRVGLVGAAQIDASGGDGGGDIAVGGQPSARADAVYLGRDTTVSANAGGTGDGGAITVTAHSARVHGRLSATGGGDGGMVRVSAPQLSTAAARVSAAATAGQAGQWHIEAADVAIGHSAAPAASHHPNFTPVAGDAVVGKTSLDHALDSGTSVTVSASGQAATGQAGNLTVADPIAKSAGAAARLTLAAANDINVNAPIVARHGEPLDVALKADSDGERGGASRINRSVLLNHGQLTLHGRSSLAADAGLLHADLVIPAAAVADLQGTLSHVRKVTIADGARLTLARHGSFANLRIAGGRLDGAGTVRISDGLDIDQGAIGGGGRLITDGGAMTQLAATGPVHIGRDWVNFGTVRWQGPGHLDAAGAAMVNAATGNWYIGGTGADDGRQLRALRFDNLGGVHVDNASLKLYADGTDSGHYRVGGDAKLAFLAGDRQFMAGSSLVSDGPVLYADGRYRFNAGATHQASAVTVDSARLTLSTGVPRVFEQLTLTGSATLDGGDDLLVSGALAFYSGLVAGSGKLLTLAGSHTTLHDNSALLYRNWDNHGAVTFTAAPSAPPALPPGLIGLLPRRQWNNYGTIDWTGPVVPAPAFGQLVMLNNQSSGVLTVHNEDVGAARQLDLAAFNNHGLVRLLSGRLQIASDGVDSGRYQAHGDGLLEWANSRRQFQAGSQITSPNPVSFSGGDYRFAQGAAYQAAKTVIDGASLSFAADPGLSDVALRGGVLDAPGGLSVDGVLEWTAGTIASGGDLRFDGRFDYRGGLLAATGTVHIDDHGGELRLPAIANARQVFARTTGDLRLTGDVRAHGAGTAITLVADGKVHNPGATLSADNGRWLLYAQTPVTSTLGGLTADFKQYGCQFGVGCNSGLLVAETVGNGLLYQVQPVLTVTPLPLSSVYGEAATFSHTLSGFIDRDTPASAGVGGQARFGVQGPLSASGRHAAGLHDLSYGHGLTNRLGYVFSDDGASMHEWTVTPRPLDIIAHDTGKLAGHPDPALTFSVAGLLAGDALSGGPARTPGEHVGDHAITVGDLDASANYSLRFTGANFTIYPWTLIEHGISFQQNTQLALLQPLLAPTGAYTPPSATEPRPERAEDDQALPLCR